MKLLNLNNKFFISLILFVFFTPLFSEDSIDIWEKKNSDKKNITTKVKDASLEKSASKIDINSELPKEFEVNTEISKANKKNK